MKHNNTLIAISGHIGSGKDLVGNILKVLLDSPGLSDQTILHIVETKSSVVQSLWKIKKYASSLKHVVSAVTGIPEDVFESQDFKKNMYWNPKTGEVVEHKDIPMGVIITSIEEYKKWLFLETREDDYCWIQVRVVLQYEGTEIGRVHRGENCWVNRLFYDYNKNSSMWIITDCRFENEAKAVRDRSGIIIRVNRKFTEIKDITRQLHSSETSLDKYQFDFVVSNDSTKINLVKQCREFALLYKLLPNE